MLKFSMREVTAGDAASWARSAGKLAESRPAAIKKLRRRREAVDDMMEK
jgi:hypothetical protein